MKQPVMQFLQILEVLNQKFGTGLLYTGITFFFLCYKWFWPTDTFPPIIGKIQYGCMLMGIILCVIRIALFLRKYPYYTLLSFALLAGAYWMAYRVTHSLLIFWSLIPALAARDSDIKKILKIYVAVLSAMIIAGNIFYWAGWSADIQKHTFSLAAHSWGVSNPNLLGITLQTIVFAVLALWQPRKDWMLWTICIAAASIIWFFTLCGTAVIAILAFPIFYFILKCFSVKPIYWAATPLLCLAISIGIALYYGPSMGETTFESRFSMPYMFYLEQGITWFGQDCHLIHLKTVLAKGIDAICLDNIYLRIPLEYGIIPSFIIYSLLCYNIYCVAKQYPPFILAMATCFLLVGFTENTSIMFFFNFTLLMSFLQSHAHNENRNEHTSTTTKMSKVLLTISPDAP